ncbi:MAG TPA: hypothetical protein VIH85_14180, partial [Solirubrobacteraceae bacterium]
MRGRRGLLTLAIAVLAAVALPGSAGASAEAPPSGAADNSSSPIISVFAGQTVSGAAIPCTTQTDGTRVCYGTYDNGTGDTDLRLKSFDGTPLALYLTLPAAPASGADGPYPLIIQSHGWGEPPTGP